MGYTSRREQGAYPDGDLEVLRLLAQAVQLVHGGRLLVDAGRC